MLSELLFYFSLLVVLPSLLIFMFGELRHLHHKKSRVDKLLASRALENLQKAIRDRDELLLKKTIHGEFGDLEVGDFEAGSDIALTIGEALREEQIDQGDLPRDQTGHPAPQKSEKQPKLAIENTGIFAESAEMVPPETLMLAKR